jgi:hypothetical protein
MARGRTEIARYLQVEVKSVLTDYQAAKGACRAADRRPVEADHRDDAERHADGEVLGRQGWLVLRAHCLELEAYSSAIQAHRTSSLLRDALVDRARKSFSARDTEVSRY